MGITGWEENMAEPDPIIYVDHSEVREGRLEELRTRIAELAKFVEANEPRITAYNVYFTEDSRRMTVVHVHPDSASLEFHMRMAGPLFARFAVLVKLLSIDVYGKPSEDIVEQLRNKARMLGEGTVVVHGRHAGFARLEIR
jgi:hypothetical protein